MTKARTLADLISDGVIGTTELADDAITPVKLDETGNYTIAQLGVNGTITSDGLTVDGAVVFNEASADVDFRVESNGNANMLFVDGGNDAVVIGHNDATNGTFASSQKLQMVGTDFLSSSFGLSRFSADGSGPSISLSKSRASGIGTDTVVQDNDDLGSIIFTGADGTDLATLGAEIKAEVDGTPGGNDMPTRLTFATTGDGNSSPTTRMRIDSSGNVGIGVTPADSFGFGKALDIGSASGSFIYVRDTDATNGIGGIGYSGTRMYISNKAAGPITFQVNADATERMRIDSSGNLLVGTTDTSLYNNTTGGGLAYRPNNELTVAAESSPQFIVNNTGNDGEMVRLAKDGTTVGSIGSVASGANLYISAATGVGLGIGGDNLYPVNASGASTNASLDIGDASARFKDAYLSGGVYLGGTGSANKLEDYEEGVYQYTLTGSTSGSENIRSGYAYFSYTKIGRMVKVMGRFELLSSSGASGNLQFSMPFTQVNNLTDQADTGVGTVTLFRTGLTGMETVIRGIIYPGSDKLVAVRQTGSGSEQQISGANVDTAYEGYLEVTMLVD